MEGKKLFAVSMQIPEVFQEGAANRIFELGIPGAQIDESKQIPEITTYIEGENRARTFVESMASYLKSLVEIFPDENDFTIKIKEVDSTNWTRAWMDHFKPVKISDRFVVRPSWEPYDPKGNEIVIEIDPEMAFGTGTHETTTLCVQAIERVLGDSETARFSSMLDIGTGTGILAIAAAKLGLKNVVGIDIDPIAVKTAANNAGLNGVENRCEFSSAPLSNIKGVFDLIVANITSDTLCALSGGIAKKQNPGGTILMSGIVTERATEVIECFGKIGYEGFQETRMNEWSLLMADYIKGHK